MPSPYIAWPTVDDAEARLARAGVALRVPQGDPSLQATVDAVVDEIGHKTQRQFLAGPAGETRIYDGTGTAELEVDEMVALAGVSIIGLDFLPAYGLPDALLISGQGRPQTRIAVSRGSLPALTPLALYPGFFWVFPAGRQNVAVTGTFGFAAAIPPALWDAACGEIALRLAEEAVFTQGGRVSELRGGDEAKKFALDGPEATGWHRRFAQALRDWRRPDGRRLRNLRPQML